MEDLREDLRELTDAATVLLDDRLYTFESYRALVQAVAYAKVALADDAAAEETLRGAYTGLCEAVDGMELREKPSEEKSADKKQAEGLQKALPYLMGGAALCGLLLGKKLFGKKKTKEKKEEGKER